MLKTNDFFIRNTLKKYLGTTILSLLGTLVVAFLNSLMVGNVLGSQGLAAMNLVNPISFIYAMLGCLIGIGGAACVSLSIGKEETEKAGSFTSMSFLMAIVLPIIISIVALFSFEPLMWSLGVRDSYYQYAVNYARIMLVGGVFSTFMYYPFNFLRVDGHPNDGMLMFVVLGVSDIGLAVLFLQKGMGLMGIGYAVVISSALADLTGLSILLKKKEQIFFGKIKQPIKDFIQITRTGSSAALNNLCNLFRTLIMNSLILAYMGENGVSIFAVVCSVLNFATAFVAGSGQTVTPLIGIFAGEKDTLSIKTVMKQTIRYSTVMLTILFIGSFFYSGILSKWFGITEPKLLQETSRALIWMMSSLILASINNIFIFYFMTVKKVLLSSLLTFLRAFGFVVLAAGIFLKCNKWNMVWSCFVIGEILTFLVMILLISCLQNKKQKGILLIDPSIEAEGKYISFSVEGSEEGAVKASTIMEQFCNEHEEVQNYAMMLPLALEEMLVLIAKHCLKDHSDYYSDVRILVTKEEVILRIRCGGQIFDPLEYYRKKEASLTEEELLIDDTLGIKMISGVAKNILFRRTLGVNNLMITL